jgi:hypothetical protein
MMLPYVFHPIAAVEIEDAVDYYESLQPGKGLDLAEQVEAAIKQIQIFPESAPITRGTVRSIVVRHLVAGVTRCTIASNQRTSAFLRSHIKNVSRFTGLVAVKGK